MAAEIAATAQILLVVNRRLPSPNRIVSAWFAITSPRLLVERLTADADPAIRCLCHMQLPVLHGFVNGGVFDTTPRGGRCHLDHMNLAAAGRTVPSLRRPGA